MFEQEHSTLNRTKLELKRDMSEVDSYYTPALNRTKLELKRYVMGLLIGSIRSLNRTKLELKHIFKSCYFL